MKEKKYFCDVSGILFSMTILLAFFVFIIGGGLYIYRYQLDNYKNDLDAYNPDQFQFIDTISQNVIKKNGIDTTKIPDDIEYTITTEGDNIELSLKLRDNEETIYKLSPEITYKFNKNEGEIISKERNYDSEVEYLKRLKEKMLYTSITVGMFAFDIVFVIILIIFVIAYFISKRNKERGK